MREHQALVGAGIARGWQAGPPDFEGTLMRKEAGGRAVTAAELIPAMTERIVRRFDPLSVILFGSQARGDAGPWSDVDLLVVLPEVADTIQARSDIYRELRDFRVSTDITVTTPEEISRRGDLVGAVDREVDRPVEL